MATPIVSLPLHDGTICTQILVSEHGPLSSSTTAFEISEQQTQDPSEASLLSLQQSLLWDDGKLPHVRFLNGNETFQEKVKQDANKWTLHANIKFRYVDANSESEIRVSFDQNDRLWSEVGTTSSLLGAGLATV